MQEFDKVPVVLVGLEHTDRKSVPKTSLSSAKAIEIAGERGQIAGILPDGKKLKSVIIRGKK